MSERTETSATISINGKDFVSLSTDILKKKRSFSFKAFGSSMWPFIKPGDILIVEAVDPATIMIGDVVFSRMSASKIIVHRIISINHVKKSAAMRGDSATSGREIISFSQVLGKVTRIKRDGKAKSLDHPWKKQLILLWYLSYPIRPFLLSLRKFGRYAMGWFIIKLTAFSFYRKLVKQKLSNRVHYRLASKADSEILKRLHSSVSGQPPFPVSTTAIHYTFLALYKSTIIGTTTLVKFPNSIPMFSGWWIFGMKTRIPFRGAGIGRQLLQLALAKARSENGKFIYLMVEANQIAARSLYAKSGFRRTFLPKSANMLEHEVKQGLSQQIILKKQL